MKSLVLNKIRDFFIVDWKKKLFSLVMAFSLWLYLNLGDYKERIFSLPIVFQNLPEGMVILEGSQMVATLNIRARNYQFTQIDFPNVIRPVVDLQHATVGEWRFPIRIEVSNINPAPGITLANPEARVIIDQLENREIPIRVQIESQPAPGFQIESVKLSRDKVGLQGPGSLLRALQFVDTRPINAGLISNNVEIPVELELPYSVKYADDTAITAKITVVRRASLDELRIQAVLTNLPGNLSPVTAPTVLLRVDAGGALPTNASSLVHATVDCSGLTAPGYYERPVVVELPDGWKLISGPDKVRFELVLEE